MDRNQILITVSAREIKVQCGEYDGGFEIPDKGIILDYVSDLITEIQNEGTEE